jgi:hypothetical protein
MTGDASFEGVWIHFVETTYGEWLHGDARSFRTRHHREHVEGDYKNPPPAGKYEKLQAHSDQLMKRRKVELTPKQRKIACDAMVASLKHDGAECLAACVGKKHSHALIRTVSLDQHRTESFLFRDARRVMGRAKGRSARVLSKCGELPEGGAWAVRCRPIPIKNRAHQLRVCDYIPDHEKKGAAVYCSAQVVLRRSKKPRA